MGIRRAEFDRCYELEVLEPRVMLSGDGMVAAPAPDTEAGSRIEVAASKEEAKTATSDNGITSLTQGLTEETVQAVWINPEGGDWNEAANWEDGMVPTAGDEVMISDVAGDAVITVSETLPDLAALQIIGATVEISADQTLAQLSLSAGATLKVVNGATLTITEGGQLEVETSTAHLEDGRLVIAATASANFSESQLTGSGDVEVAGTLDFDGALQPGATDVAGNLNLSTVAEIEGASILNLSTVAEIEGASITLSGEWTMAIDVWTADAADGVVLSGNVNLAEAGSVVVKTDTADLTDGTILANLVTLPESIEAPTTLVTTGADQQVATTWSETGLQIEVSVPTMEVVAPKAVAENTAVTVGDSINAGLGELTTSMQSLLDAFDLTTISFAATGRPSFALPTLPTALDDLFDLTAQSAGLVLPEIGAASTVAEARTALTNAGYTVSDSATGADFEARLSRQVAADLGIDPGYAQGNFVEPADLLAGLADTLNLTATLNLLATLMQRVAFEWRDGGFSLLTDTNLALAVAGAATLTGSVRQGGRTVTASGSTAVDVNLTVFKTDAGTAASASGTVKVSLDLAGAPVAMDYSRDYTMSRTAETGSTTVASTAALTGTLTLPGVTDGSGHAAQIALTGTLEAGGAAWKLSGSQADLTWQGLAVAAQNFAISVSGSSFTGSGTLQADLDFLSEDGSTPTIDFTAGFDQDTISLNGTMNTDVISVVNPAGGNYLSIGTFAASGSLSGDFGSGAWTGQLTFTGGESQFEPDATGFSSTITDGDDADDYAVTGSYDFAGQTFTTTADQFEILAANLVKIVAAGLTLQHKRNVTDEQELVQLDNAPVALLFLKSTPSTGPPSTSAASVSIRTNGFAIGEGSLNIPTITLGGTVAVSDAAVSFEGISILSGTVSADEVNLTADTGTLFPDNDGFTATATTLSGSYDLTKTDDRLELGTDALSFSITGSVKFDASNLTLRPESDTVLAVDNIQVSLGQYGLSGEINGLALTKTGAATVDGMTLQSDGPGQVSIGQVLPVLLNSVTVNFAGDVNGNGTRDEGETFTLDAFALAGKAVMDYSKLANLPFPLEVELGGSLVDDGSDVFDLELRKGPDGFTPAEIGTVTLRIKDWELGGSFTLNGSITLGELAGVNWTPVFAGSLTIADAGESENLSGDLNVAVSGTWDPSTLSATMAAEFSLNFNYGDYLEVTNAKLAFGFTIQSVGSGTDFGNGLYSHYHPEIRDITAAAASVQRAALTIGEHLTMEANGLVVNFLATGDQVAFAIESAKVEIAAISLVGQSTALSVLANGKITAGETGEFKVSFSQGDDFNSRMGLPFWMPFQVRLIEAHWQNIEDNVLDFTLRVSATVGVDGLGGRLPIKGTAITLIGSIDNLVIDVGKLINGEFYITEFPSEFNIAIGGSMGGSTISGALILGLARVDADGNIIGSSDTTTPVAQQVIWGAIQGEIVIAGYGGFALYLGMSQYGPMQGYIKVVAPVVVDPFVTGLALTDFRAGITFNTTIPEITDARDMFGPGFDFKPVNDMTFNEWRAQMISTLQRQIKNHQGDAGFAALLDHFRIEGGVTIFSSYASRDAFSIEADFLMDTTGKSLFYGRFKLAKDTMTFRARLYTDLSKITTEGRANMLFAAEIPIDPAKKGGIRLYGQLLFDFGVTIDHENPPTAAFEQFQVTIIGGIEMRLFNLVPLFTIEGQAIFDVKLDMPSLHLTVEGRAKLIGLGDVVGMSGEFDVYFDGEENVQLIGVLSIAPRDLSALEKIGLELDGLAVMRFNSTGESVDYTLTLPGQTEAKTFTLNPNEGSILHEGYVSFSVKDTEVFYMQGLTSFVWTEGGFDAVVSGTIMAGARAAPLLRFDANGYLKLVVEGISVGMAASLNLSLEDSNPLRTAGVQLTGDFTFMMNTLGVDVDYETPTYLLESTSVDRIHLPRGPPSRDGNSVGEAGPYMLIRANGTMRVLDQVVLTGMFDLTAANGVVDLSFDAFAELKAGDTTYFHFTLSGQFRLDSSGLYGGVDMVLDHDLSQVKKSEYAALIPDFAQASFSLQVNTTGAAQEIDGRDVEAGDYLRMRGDGELTIGQLTLAGVFDLSIEGEYVALDASGSISLSTAGVEFYKFSYDGVLRLSLDGLFANLQLVEQANGRQNYGFGFGDTATFTLGINTTSETIQGVPSGLGARVRVSGSLEIGDWRLDGVYDLTATTTGIGFAASASLIVRAEEQELMRVPLDFAIELTIPGIVHEIDIEGSLAELGLNIPGLDLEGSVKVQINTTNQPQGNLKAGPFLNVAIDGRAVIGGVTLTGDFYLDATVNATTLHSSASVTLGPVDAPLMRFATTGAFDLNFTGIAGRMTATHEESAGVLADFVSVGFDFNLEVNTRSTAVTIGDTTLAAGPYAILSATGHTKFLGLDFNGRFDFSAQDGVVNVDLDANLSVAIEDLTLFSFTAQGGLRVDGTGMSAALDLDAPVNLFSEIGLGFDEGSQFRLRINTTGTEQNRNGIILEAGNYARVDFNAALTFGAFRIEGDYHLKVEGNTATLDTQANLIVGVPALENAAAYELFRMAMSGGFEISRAGVAAVFDLNAGSLEQISFGDIVLPVTTGSTYRLQLNTTGEARTIAGIDLAAGRYARIDTQGKFDIGFAKAEGQVSIYAGQKGVELDFVSVVKVGIPGTQLEIIQWDLRGGFSVTAKGVYGIAQLTAGVGLSGLQSLGITFDTVGQHSVETLVINTTGVEQTAGELTIEAGNYIEFRYNRVMSIGAIRSEGGGTMRLASDGLHMYGKGELFMGIPGVFTLYRASNDMDWRITSEGAWGRSTLTRSNDAITIGDLSISPDANQQAVLQFNTTSKTQTIAGEDIKAGTFHIASNTSIDFLGQTFIGDSLLAVDTESGYGMISFTGDLKIRLGDWEAFDFSADGFFAINNHGVAVGMELTAKGSSSIAGARLSGNFKLEASTLREQIVVPDFKVGEVSVPGRTVGVGKFFRVHLDGSLTTDIGLSANGTFDMLIDGNGFAVDASISITALGVTLSGSGLMRISSEGVVAKFTLNSPRISNALYTVDAGTFELAINTTGKAQSGLAARIAEIGIRDAEIAVLNAKITGTAYITFDGGVTLRIIDMTSTLNLPWLGGIKFTVNGWMNTAGQFRFTGTTDIAIGSRSSLGIFAQAEVTVSSADGIYGTFAGIIEVPGPDYGNASGSFSANSSGITLNVAHSAFYLLNNLVLVQGGVTLRGDNQGVLTATFHNVTGRINAPGLTQTLTLNGSISTNGYIDLHGTMDLNVGDTVLGLRTSASVTIRNDSIIGSLSGRLYVPGDYSEFSGDFYISSSTFVINVYRARFSLLGGAIILEGGGSLRVSSTGMRLEVKNVTADVSGVFRTTVSGHIDTNGSFSFDGTLSLNTGSRSLAAIEGSMRLQVSSDSGVRGWLNGNVYLLGSRVAGIKDTTISFDSSGFNLRTSFNLGWQGFSFWGTLNMSSRSGEVSASLSGSASLWGLSGNVSASFGKGSYSMSGDLSFSTSGGWLIEYGASGKLKYSINNGNVSIKASGSAWIGTYVYYLFGRDWKQVSTQFSGSIDLGKKTASVSVKLLGITYSLKVSFANGVTISKSNVGGSLVFLDVNRNGQLDAGEPFTTADGDGYFTFNEDEAVIEPVAVDPNQPGSVTGDVVSLGVLSVYDADGDGYLDESEGIMHVVGGRHVFSGAAGTSPVAVDEHLDYGTTEWAGATIFFDLNGDGLRQASEPFTTTDEAGNFDFNPIEVPEVDVLGRLAQFDTNGDGELTSDEIALYAVNGTSLDELVNGFRIYDDANGNGRLDSGELSAHLTPDFTEDFHNTRVLHGDISVVGTPLAIFDRNGDGILSGARADALVFVDETSLVPLTRIPSLATGALPVTNAEYVFADANGNGRYDEGEPMARPDDRNIYTFVEGPAPTRTNPLGRLAPFDTNGNGVIDHSEGVLVALGGTDTDNGLEAPFATMALAANYGQGIAFNMNPLSTLQVALVDRGMSAEDADQLVNQAFALADQVNVDLMQPGATVGGMDSLTENSVLSAMAQLTSLVTGGAGLFGDLDGAAQQDAMLDALADWLYASTQDNDLGDEVLDLRDAAALSNVLGNASNRLGANLSTSQIDAAAAVLGIINHVIVATAEDGGAVDRELAQVKAELFTDVADLLRAVGRGEVDADAVAAAFTLENFLSDVDENALLPTTAPELEDIGDQVVAGGDRLTIALPIYDTDSRLDSLDISLVADTPGLVNTDAVEFVLDGAQWVMIVPTFAVGTGSTELTLRVSDGEHVRETRFRVTFNGINNTVQLIRPVPAQILGEDEMVGIDLRGVFSDPNGDATYELVPVGENQVVTAVIENGVLILTGDRGLAGLAVFDLIARDANGATNTRFAVAVYPELEIGQHVGVDSEGRAVITLHLSIPSTQALVFGYDAGLSQGSVVFAPGETTQTIRVTLPADGDVYTDGLSFSLDHQGVVGEFTVGLNRLSAVELMGMRRTAAEQVTVSFRLTFESLLVDEDDGSVVRVVRLTPVTEKPETVTSKEKSVARSSAANDSELVSESSLESLMQPRGITLL